MLQFNFPLYIWELLLYCNQFNFHYSEFFYLNQSHECKAWSFPSVSTIFTAQTFVQPVEMWNQLLNGRNFGRKLRKIIQLFNFCSRCHDVKLCFLRLWKTFLIKNEINKMRKLKIFFSPHIFPYEFQLTRENSTKYMKKLREVLKNFLSQDRSERENRGETNEKGELRWPNKSAREIRMT